MTSLQLKLACDVTPVPPSGLCPASLLSLLRPEEATLRPEDVTIPCSAAPARECVLLCVLTVQLCAKG